LIENIKLKGRHVKIPSKSERKYKKLKGATIRFFQSLKENIKTERCHNTILSKFERKYKKLKGATLRFFQTFICGGIASGFAIYNGCKI
jgi:hypothetical protein